MKFPSTLKDLEVGLAFFGYYRKYVWRYSAVIQPLQDLKTLGYRTAPRKGKPRERYGENHTPGGTEAVLEMPEERRRKLIEAAEQAWEEVKTRLIDAPVLAHPDFSQGFLLYVDSSLQHGIGAAIHQIQDGTERVICFLSRTLAPAEKNYWATELEMLGLVWTLRKVPEYFDEHSFTVITDHSALVSCLQGQGRGRRAARLNEWAMFLSTYLPRMKVVHREGKSHHNADGLSRIKTGEEDNENESPEDRQARERALQQLRQARTETMKSKESLAMANLACLPDACSSPSGAGRWRALKQLERVRAGLPLASSSEAPGQNLYRAWSAAVMQLSDEFLEQVRSALPVCPSFAKVYHKLTKARDAARQENQEVVEWQERDFVLRADDLLYCLADGMDRMVLPRSLHQEIFQLVHDDNAHAGVERAYTKARETIFTPELKDGLTRYVKTCPACQVSKPLNHKPYGKLHPVPTPERPFQVLAVDFAVSFPVADGFDAIMVVVCKLTKFLRLIKGKDTWTAEQ